MGEGKGSTVQQQNLTTAQITAGAGKEQSFNSFHCIIFH